MMMIKSLEAETFFHKSYKGFKNDEDWISEDRDMQGLKNYKITKITS